MSDSQIAVVGIIIMVASATAMMVLINRAMYNNNTGLYGLIKTAIKKKRRK